MRRNLKFIVLLLGLVLIFSAGFLAGNVEKRQVLSQNSNILPSKAPTVSSTSSTNPSLGPLYPVLKVVDGDTIDVSIDGRSKAVRLIGIDTPEAVDPRKPVQCFGNEASAQAKKILTGKSVYLQSDPSQGDLDKYKRLLRYVFLQDGTNFNQMMIAQGFAHEYTYNLPYKYQTQFKFAEREAREKELGLWSPAACNGNTSSPSSFNQSPTPEGQANTSDYKPTGTYACDCSKLCSKISTCDEAYYQLKNCGCSARDSDGDGVPCETLCR